MDLYDADEVQADFSTLIGILGRSFPHCERRCGGDEVREAAVTFCRKFAQHGISAQTLIRDGSAHRRWDKRFLDSPSVFVLTRAGWECFLLFYRVFVLPQSDAEREALYLRWCLESPRKRQRYVETHLDQEQQKGREKEAIDSYRDRIRNNSWFQQRAAEDRKEFLEGGDKWRGQWAALARNAGIAALYGTSHYSWLCDQAHSGWFSIAGLGAAMSPDDSRNFLSSTIGMLAIAAAKMLVGLDRLFPGSLVNLRSTERKVLDGWLTIARTTDAEIQQLLTESAPSTEPLP